MNQKKIEFVIPVKGYEYIENCTWHINQIDCPNNFEISILKLYDNENGLCDTYNKGMSASNAKYKVYLHQDCYIIDRDFCIKLLNIFEDPTIGLYGVIGCKKLPPSGIWWETEICGLVKEQRISSERIVGNLTEAQTEVEAIDGLIMATQYDIKWRSDLFDGFDFYDISQAFEFRRKGYKIVVPAQTESMVIHNIVDKPYQHYEKYRKIFLKNYFD